MRVKLKGVNRTPVRAANGEIVEYFYAWKGGPRLVRPRAFILGGSIRKKEGRAGKRIVTPVGKPLKARLDALAESRPSARETILLTERGTPWTEGASAHRGVSMHRCGCGGCDLP
jgi:hypothetical protein